MAESRPHTTKLTTLSLTIALGIASIASATDIRVDLPTPPKDGAIVLMLFDSANAFGDFRDPVRSVAFPSSDNVSFTLTDVPAGNYALVVHHDINGNGVLDKNFIGVPTEPLAFSNGYRPKGPPSYTRAEFVLGDDQTKVMELELYQALGRRGRVGVGAGLIGRSSPYRDYTGEVSQFIPAIVYNGERFQALGPMIQFGLLGSGGLRLAATASYRIGVYEEQDSPYLDGMGDRESTLMAGFGVNYELPNGLDVTLRVETDALDRIGGVAAQLSIDKSFQLGLARITPQIGVNWQSSELANHDFGIDSEQARPTRPAYELGDILSYEFGFGTFIEISRDWQIVTNLAFERFDDEVSDSPIVVDGHVWKGFLALNYVF